MDIAKIRFTLTVSSSHPGPHIYAERLYGYFLNLGGFNWQVKCILDARDLRPIADSHGND